jgi:hypothetical protein
LSTQLDLILNQVFLGPDFSKYPFKNLSDVPPSLTKLMFFVHVLNTTNQYFYFSESAPRLPLPFRVFSPLPRQERGTDYLTSDHEEGPRPYDRPKVEQTIRDIQTMYVSWQAPHTQQPSFGAGVPASGFMQSLYLGPSWGAGGNSARRHDWYKSTVWEYWIPGCLSE